jgi:protein phosphatase PTC1
LLLKNLPTKGFVSVPEVFDQTFSEADSFLNSAHGIFSGCTAIVAFYRHEVRGDGREVDVLYTGNVGDSRAVLFRNGTAVRLSYDHKGSDIIEQQRVKDAGGFVLNDRVNGMLAITRALGDAEMKDFIAGRPYTTETIMDRSEDEFLILACDGLWDVCGDQEACEYIKDVEDPQKAAEMLIEYAIKNDSYDNLSVLVVKFRK